MSKTLKSFKPGSPIQGSYHYTELRTLSAGNVNAHPLQSYTSFSFLYSPAFINTLFLFPQTLLSSKLMVLFSQNLNRLLEFSLFFPSTSRFVSFHLPLLLHLFSPGTAPSTALQKADWKTFWATMWAREAYMECGKGNRTGSQAA